MATRWDGKNRISSEAWKTSLRFGLVLQNLEWFFFTLTLYLGWWIVRMSVISWIEKTDDSDKMAEFIYYSNLCRSDSPDVHRTLWFNGSKSNIMYYYRNTLDWCGFWGAETNIRMPLHASLVPVWTCWLSTPSSPMRGFFKVSLFWASDVFFIFFKNHFPLAFCDILDHMVGLHHGDFYPFHVFRGHYLAQFFFNFLINWFCIIPIFINMVLH